MRKVWREIQGGRRVHRGRRLAKFFRVGGSPFAVAPGLQHRPNQAQHPSYLPPPRPTRHNSAAEVRPTASEESKQPDFRESHETPATALQELMSKCEGTLAGCITQGKHEIPATHEGLPRPDPGAFGGDCRRFPHRSPLSSHICTAVRPRTSAFAGR
jgi:hypothetical protein